MVITEYKDVLDRLINILNYKKITCKKKLAELEKINNIKEILVKYPDDTLKSILEINDKDLCNYFLQFQNIKYTLKDIETKKYWINEGSNNDLIKRSEQYKESINIFNTLIDTMQMYLDYTRSFVLIKETILNEYNIITSLIDRIINNIPIIDMSPYYSIFMENETITCKKMYSYISAISIHNVDAVENLKIKYDDIKINKENKSYLIMCLQKTIEDKEKFARDNDFLNKKIAELKALIKKIKSNYNMLFDVYPDTISEIMKDVWEDGDIKYYLDKLAVPIALIKGKNKGLNLTLSDQDNENIGEFVDDLEDKLKKITEKEKNINNKEKFSKLDDIANLNKIVYKLEKFNNELLSFEDYLTIINILVEKSEKHNFILDLLNDLNMVNIKKLYKGKKENVCISDDDKTFDNKTIDKRILKKVEVLFNKYGFNYDSFSIKIIEDLVSTTDFNQIKKMVEYLNSINELSFLKDYTLPVGNGALDREIQEIKCSQICFILGYSTEFIINNLIDISKKYNIDLHDIFSIPKVFASNSNKKIKGTYEDFTKNIKYIYSDYPDIFNKIISNYPFILGTDSDLFRKNIELTEVYGMSISKDSKGNFPSPMALSIENFEYTMDRYIEVDGYDCVEAYRSLLQNNSNVELKIRYKEMKNIDINSCLKYDSSKIFKSDIEKYLDGLNIENIAVALSDPFIKKLDKLFEKKSNKVMYKICDVYISRIKVLKYYGTFLINKYKDKKEALIYSIIKDSYLTENEFISIKNYILESEV